MDIIDKIKILKREKNAAILVHNYQPPILDNLADYIGDSYTLASKAAELDSKIIIFCGFTYMAETTYILNPDKKILLPPLTEECLRGSSLKPQELRILKKKNPDATIVSYINAPAILRAETEISCTAANAVLIINALQANKILFGPDINLALFVQRHSEKKILPWGDHCYVHNSIQKKVIVRLKRMYPDAEVIAHPECKPEVIDIADHTVSTNWVQAVVKRSKAKAFIVATDGAIIDRLKKYLPERKYIAAAPSRVCKHYSENVFDLIYQSLLTEQPVITVDETIRVKAKKAIDQMTSIL